MQYCTFCAVLIKNGVVLNMKVCSMENLNFSVSTLYYKTVSQQCRTMDWARKAPNKERGRDYDLIISRDIKYRERGFIQLIQ